MRTLSTLLALGAVVAFAESAHAGFVNAGFEAPVISGGTFQTITPPGTVAFAWTVAGGNAYVVSEGPTGQFGDTPDGQQYVTMDAGASIKQSDTTTNGQIYDVTFLLNYHRDVDPNSARSVTVAAFDGATQLGTQTFTLTSAGSKAYSTSRPWTTETFSFTATSTLTALRFTWGAGSFGLYLDAVSMAPHLNDTSPTPEPTSIALLGMGAFGFARLARRRRSV